MPRKRCLSAFVRTLPGGKRSYPHFWQKTESHAFEICSPPRESPQAQARRRLVVTEWQEFRNPDFEVLRRLMNRRVIVDGRNLYDPAQMAQLGFTYASIGRGTVVPKP